jgi:hypothetical protein
MNSSRTVATSQKCAGRASRLETATRTTPQATSSVAATVGAADAFPVIPPGGALTRQSGGDEGGSNV